MTGPKWPPTCPDAPTDDAVGVEQRENGETTERLAASRKNIEISDQRRRQNVADLAELDGERAMPDAHVKLRTIDDGSNINGSNINGSNTNGSNTNGSNTNEASTTAARACGRHTWAGSTRVKATSTAS